MTKYIYGILITGAIIVGVFYFFDKQKAPSGQISNNNEQPAQNSNEDENILTDQSAVRPWVEVVSEKVSVQTEEGWQDLQTGDEIPDGATISTDLNGLANIHMPDGSSIQLDSNSEITLEQADYADDSDTLKVKIRLTAGRVWSKIMELATTDSYWEVKTSNAVASVRGTAFGMEYDDEETQIIGSENTVEVDALDPSTGQSLGRAPVTARKILAIKKQTLSDLRARRAVLAGVVREIGEDVESRPWVKRAIISDQLLNKKIDALREKGIENIEIKRTIRRELLERRRQILLKLRESGILPRAIKPLLINSNITGTGDNKLLVAPQSTSSDYSDTSTATTATLTPAIKPAALIIKPVTTTIISPNILQK
ncbi:MAG: FecR family protein [Candidatus Magasanikbacteria bacterium]|nr:FecR family protein [Candidatus Magasanikbacteria bacterium]